MTEFYQNISNPSHSVVSLSESLYGDVVSHTATILLCVFIECLLSVSPTFDFSPNTVNLHIHPVHRL